jgi:hypothetical protein
MKEGNICNLAAAAVIGFAAVGFTAPSHAGGLDLGGVVGGTLGALGGSGSSYSGSSGSSYSGTSSGSYGGTSGGYGYSGKGKGGIKAKAYVTLLKKKHLVKAKVFIGKNNHYKHAKLVKVAAVIGKKPLDVKAKVYVADLVKAKVYTSVGYKTNVFAKVAVADLAKIKIGVGPGGYQNRSNPPNGNTVTPPNDNGSNPGRVASTFRELSDHDQNVMSRKCGAVLAQPYSYDSDTVELCRLIATL